MLSFPGHFHFTVAAQFEQIALVIHTWLFILVQEFSLLLFRIQIRWDLDGWGQMARIRWLGSSWLGLGNSLSYCFEFKLGENTLGGITATINGRTNSRVNNGDLGVK